jgi:hypothetical protein
MGKSMRNLGQVGLIFVLAVLADGTVALAQGYAYYNRLRDERSDPTPLSSMGIRVARSSSSTAVARTARASDKLNPNRAEQTIRAGRSAGPNTTVTRTVYETDPLHPYSSEFIAQAQRPAEVPAGSTWETQPQPTVVPPQPQVVARSQPHDYYPNMRTGMTAQPPVTLTANRNVFYPGCHCTPSRAQALGGGGRR